MSDTLNITPPEPKTGSPTPFIQLSNTLSSTLTWNSNLLGRILTFADATFSDKEQREAVKSVLKNIIHEHYRNSNDDIDRILNQFTDVFDGRAIKYTTISHLGGESDCRKNPPNIIYDPPFTKN